MNSPSLVFLDVATLDHGDLDLSRLDRLGKVTLHPLTPAGEIVQRIAEADIVLTNKTVLNAATLTSAPRLKLIAVCATGANNVDLDAAKTRGIRVTNVTGYGSFSVAQHAVAFILNWATQMHRYVGEAKAWSQSPMFTRLDYPVFELAGRTLGLIGTGRIGSEVARMASALGMKVQAAARSKSPISDPQSPIQDPWPRFPTRWIFETSDVISLHCPLTEKTRHIINRESIGWMKRGAFLVNTGRGDLVDELALKEALVSGKLGGAGLDVLSTEPPLADHPLLDERVPNLMITPHSAWTAREARKRLLDEVIANIEAFLRGKDRNRVV